MNNFKRLRVNSGYSQAQLAELVSVHQTAVSQWELEKSTPDIEVLKKLSVIYGVSVDFLLGLGESNSETAHGRNVSPAHLSPNRVMIPVLGSIPAGVPVEAVEDIIGWEDIPKEWTDGGRQYYGLRVEGESMYPEYIEGDIVILRKQPTCDSGDDCAVMVNQADATLKRVYIHEDGIELRALNPKFSTKFYTNQKVLSLPVQVIGVVEELRRKKRKNIHAG